MAKFKLYDGNKYPGLYVFECPGCGCLHFVQTGQPTRFLNIVWGFNGDLDKPTVTPSILITSSWQGKEESRCHSFVRNGNIEFLNDCTHEMAGKTVELKDI